YDHRCLDFSQVAQTDESAKDTNSYEQKNKKKKKTSEDKALILSRQNHEKWFRKVEFKSKSRGSFYVAYTTKANFVWIKREVGLSTIIKEEAESPSAMSSKRKENEKKDSVQELTSKFEGLGGTWNTEKLKMFEQDTAKFFSYISDLFSDDD
ncbi:hypothetical protein GcC1_031024, partial [Golovinomyces cichoracearum]